MEASPTVRELRRDSAMVFSFTSVRKPTAWAAPTMIP